jgi:hypothetical protein
MSLTKDSIIQVCHNTHLIDVAIDVLKKVISIAN